MLAGEPRSRAPAQAIVARVMTESPGRSHPAATVPRHIEAAVLTALEKLPADRFATAAAFAEALRTRPRRYVALARRSHPLVLRSPVSGTAIAPRGRRCWRTRPRLGLAPSCPGPTGHPVRAGPAQDQALASRATEAVAGSPSRATAGDRLSGSPDTASATGTTVGPAQATPVQGTKSLTSPGFRRTAGGSPSSAMGCPSTSLCWTEHPRSR